MTAHADSASPQVPWAQWTLVSVEAEQAFSVGPRSGHQVRQPGTYNFIKQLLWPLCVIEKPCSEKNRSGGPHSGQKKKSGLEVAFEGPLIPFWTFSNGAGVPHVIRKKESSTKKSSVRTQFSGEWRGHLEFVDASGWGRGSPGDVIRADAPL